MILIRIFFLVLTLLLPVVVSAADQPAVNTICPVTGKPVDATIPAVIVTVGKGERAKRISIAVADRAAADKVKTNPSDSVEAAKAKIKAK